MYSQGTAAAMQRTAANRFVEVPDDHDGASGLLGERCKRGKSPADVLLSLCVSDA